MSNESWISIKPPEAEEGNFSFSLEINEGESNFLQISFSDHAGNKFFSDIFSLIGNRHFSIHKITPQDGAQFNLGELIHFTINATDPDGDTLTYEWIMNDSIILNQNLSFYHSFGIGDISVTLTVTDSHNHTMVIPISITVTEPQDNIIPDDNHSPIKDRWYIPFIIILVIMSIALIIQLISRKMNS
jgi:hypothetical protein